MVQVMLGETTDQAEKKDAVCQGFEQDRGGKPRLTEPKMQEQSARRWVRSLGSTLPSAKSSESRLWTSSPAHK